MSTVQVANIHFEPTGNNRIQYDGSNVSIYKTGSLILTANSTTMNLSDGISNKSFGTSLPAVDQVTVGQYILSVNTPNASFVNTDSVYDQTSYSALYTAVGDITTYDWPISKWIARTGATPSVRGMAYGNGVYVSVTVGAIQSSTDGITWAARTSNTTSDIRAVTYGNGTFVACGNDSVIRTSTDSIAWFNRTAAAGGNFRAATYGNGIFVIGEYNTAGLTSMFQSSTDGITWTQRTGADSFKGVLGLGYGNGVFVAVAAGSEIGATGSIQSSTDGITWTNRTSTPSATRIGVAYGNGVFVVAGSGQSVQTSTDGTTWTNRTTANASAQQAITYGNGIFVSVGNTGSIQTSTDGTTWTNRTIDTTGTLAGATYGNNIFVVGGPIFTSGNPLTQFYIPPHPLVTPSTTKAYVRAT